MVAKGLISSSDCDPEASRLPLSLPRSCCHQIKKICDSRYLALPILLEGRDTGRRGLGHPPRVGSLPCDGQELKRIL